MSRGGFGFGAARRQPVNGTGASLAQNVSQAGVTFNFATARPTGQYANGDWWVVGPVAITSITPGSMLHNGLNGDGTAYANRTVHGTMLNPGNRAFAVGGLTANNTTNTVQGWDSIGSSKPSVPYSAAANVDPGATGSPLVVSNGSVVKFVSRLTGLPNGAENRPAGNDIVVLTVVDSIPAADAIRPGVSRAGSKASPCRLSQFDLAVFRGLAPTANAPTYAQALDWIDRYHETSQPDSINNPVAKASNNHPEYGRDIGNNLFRALLCLHLASFTATQKRTLLAHFAAIADDLVSRAEEGGITLGAGGGNSWKLPVIVVCAAALGANAPASWLTYLSNAQRMAWAENRQIFTVSGVDIALPRFTADGRPRSPYTQQMLGSSDWGEQPQEARQYSGSNWNAFYRVIVGNSLIGGALAVELTTGGAALWDYPEFWRYMDTVFLRRAEDSPGNNVPVFVMEMLNAYRPAKTAPPAIIEAGIKGTAIWVRFDQALNDIAAPPTAGSFTVSVNGVPATISSISIWRQNLGLSLAAAVTGNDIVTISYTAAANPVRSVDGVNIANIVNQPLTNRTEKVGGPNAAYPVIRLVPGTTRLIGGTNTLAPANSSVGTLAILRFRFSALPATPLRILGSTGGPAMQIFLNTNGALELRILGTSGTIVNRPTTAALSPNVTYDILFSFDNTQANASAGANCYINGVAQTINNFNYLSGAILAWSNSAAYIFGNPGPAGGPAVEIGALWLSTTARVDLTVSANRNKFTGTTSGNLDILTRGDGITGAIPAQFLVGNADQWNDGVGMNRGTGNKFFVSGGLATLVSGSEWI